MTLTALTYLLYVFTSICITVFVARTLSRNGRLFLVDAFGDEALADSVNHLLVVGFYLINLGYVLFMMRTDRQIADFEGMIVYLAASLGFVLMAVGVVHFINMFAIHRIGAYQHRRQEETARAPANAVAEPAQSG